MLSAGQAVVVGGVKGVNVFFLALLLLHAAA
jgi:hypothetical protein